MIRLLEWVQDFSQRILGFTVPTACLRHSPQLQIQRYGSTPGFLAGPIMVVRAFCSGFPVFRSPDELIIVAFVLLANSFRLIYIFFFGPWFQFDTWTCNPRHDRHDPDSGHFYLFWGPLNSFFSILATTL